MSRIFAGFVVPGTRTYVLLGRTAGVESGIGYKIRQAGGRLCGGSCPYEESDRGNYYWLFDLEEIIAAESPSAPRPYDYGRWDVPYDNEGRHSVIGGTFDVESGRLYVTLATAGQLGDYDYVPLVVAFDVSSGG